MNSINSYQIYCSHVEPTSIISPLDYRKDLWVSPVSGVATHCPMPSTVAIPCIAVGRDPFYQAKQIVSLPCSKCPNDFFPAFEWNWKSLGGTTRSYMVWPRLPLRPHLHTPPTHPFCCPLTLVVPSTWSVLSCLQDFILAITSSQNVSPRRYEGLDTSHCVGFSSNATS